MYSLQTTFFAPSILHRVYAYLSICTNINAERCCCQCKHIIVLAATVLIPLYIWCLLILMLISTRMKQYSIIKYEVCVCVGIPMGTNVYTLQDDFKKILHGVLGIYILLLKLISYDYSK